MNATGIDRGRRLLLAGGIGMILLCGFAQSTMAEDWMFRRSYYSHALPPELPPDYPLPVSRSAYRMAYYPDGINVSAGYRVNNYIIQSGNRIDRTYYTEGWVQFQPQRERVGP